ncbi:MAG: SPFH domain-containing protein [Pseudomonadota bacterium]
MSENLKQNWVFRGIYEFEDPSGSIIAARVPQHQSADLFDNTVVVVRPNQIVIFLYKGQIADILGPGTHTISTENTPLLTRLANWKYGMRSPIRCELWFFSGSLFLTRRWGTHQPVIHSFKEGNIQVRAFGNYSFRVIKPKQLLLKIIGNRTSLVVSEVEEWIQGYIVQHFSQALQGIHSVSDLGTKQQAVSAKLVQELQSQLSSLGISVSDVQVLSLLPPHEVMQALSAQAAMNLVGDKKEYLLYKAANSLDSLHESSSNNPMQLMMGMMMGKSIMGTDYSNQKPREALQKSSNSCTCPHCQQNNSSQNKFCGQCGKELKS